MVLTILKNDGVKVNGKDDIPYMKWKMKFMFQTTNRIENEHFSPESRKKRPENW